MLDGDTSDEKQSDVAEHYQVSPMTIRTLLVNNGRTSLQDAPGLLDRTHLTQARGSLCNNRVSSSVMEMRAGGASSRCIHPEAYKTTSRSVWPATGAADA